MDRQTKLRAAGFVPTVSLALMMLAPPTATTAAPAWISMSECELNGFGLGESADQMRAALGEPGRASLVKPVSKEYSHVEFHYDGLRIVFSTSSYSAMSFVVTSGRYRLPSGVGVGSTRQEIESALGVANELASGDAYHLYYRLRGPHGQTIPALLNFKLERGVSIPAECIPTVTDGNRLIYIMIVDG